jgi:hypothetical protein
MTRILAGKMRTAVLKVLVLTRPGSAISEISATPLRMVEFEYREVGSISRMNCPFRCDVAMCRQQNHFENRSTVYYQLVLTLLSRERRFQHVGSTFEQILR